MEGKQLGGRYEILHPLGEGGMAVVYKAKDHLLNRHVAVKVMNQKLHEGEPAIQRFIHEAQTVGKFSHANIINVFDIGNEGELYYMVMELVEGPTLNKLIEERGPLPAEEAIKIVMQICDGLAHAHKQKIIHRDIKPHNIMCTPNGSYKITDFGISRLLSAATHYTKTGTVMGSVHYFSPEQACGQELSYSSDLYSLGIVLYELVTGDVPFDADQSVAIALKHLQQPIPNPLEKNQEIPASLCDIIYKALAKKPEDRYQSAEEMKQALHKALTAPASASFDQNGQKGSTTAVNPERFKQRKVLRFALLGAVPLLLILSMFFFEANGVKAPTDNKQTANANLAPATSLTDPEQQQGKQAIPKAEQVQHEEKKTDREKQDGKELTPELNPDHPSTVPTPEEPSEETPMNETPPPAQEPGSVTYLVIVDQFSDQASADQCVQTLNSKGIEASYHVTNGDAGTNYVVTAGEFNEEQAANDQAEQVRNAGYPNAKVAKKA